MTKNEFKKALWAVFRDMQAEQAKKFDRNIHDDANAVIFAKKRINAMTNVELIDRLTL